MGFSPPHNTEVVAKGETKKRGQKWRRIAHLRASAPFHFIRFIAFDAPRSLANEMK
jgi:hypothetical protein